MSAAATSPADPAVVEVAHLSKRFTLHLQGGAELPVLDDVSLSVRPGECLALHGPSGAGKSTLLKCIYANYRASAGSIRVLHHGQPLEVTAASAQELLALRRDTVGYVSQFLRVIPRVPAVDVVAEPLLDAIEADGGAGGNEGEEARRAARFEAERLLLRLRIPRKLWSLPPATFSGGEQQRVNIARSFIRRRPLMLLDEPTASLDSDNRTTVALLIGEALEAGSAVIGIFHDARMRQQVATRLHDMEQQR